MSNLIVANLKNGKEVAIGYNMGGHFPMFFIRREWGNVPSFNNMLDWLKVNAESIFIGSYGTGPAPYCYTSLSPVEFGNQASLEWRVMTGGFRTLTPPTESKEDIFYKHIRVRYYGSNSHKVRIKFIDGIYTEMRYSIPLCRMTEVHWTYESPKRFA